MSSQQIIVGAIALIIVSGCETMNGESPWRMGTRSTYASPQDMVYQYALNSARQLGLTIQQEYPAEGGFEAGGESMLSEKVSVRIRSLSTSRTEVLVATQPGRFQRTPARDFNLPMQQAIARQVEAYNIGKRPDSIEPPELHKREVDRPKVQGQRWALVIGVSDYADSRIPDLRYAEADAKAFHDWLIAPDGGRYAPSRVRLLLGQNATNARLKEALFEWLAPALEEDIVCIYFAGHGSPQSPDQLDNLFLLPYDTNYQKIASTAFPMWDIQTALQRYIKAKRVVVIADACHSGGIGSEFDDTRRATERGMGVQALNAGLVNAIESREGVCLFSAADQDQTSRESENYGGGHGIFTWYLLQGLRGDADFGSDDDDIVTMGELLHYVSQSVRRATRNNQTPRIAGSFDPAMSLAGPAPVSVFQNKPLEKKR